MGGGNVQDAVITICEFNNVDLKNMAWRECGILEGGLPLMHRRLGCI